MKTIEQIFRSKPVFLHDWEDGKKFQIMCDFEDIYITEEEYKSKECPIGNKPYWIEKKQKVDSVKGKWKKIKILFATYTYEDYSGSAWVLFEENGKLYEASGGHCSCYGLEGQWEPEIVNIIELKNRIVNGTHGEEWGEGDYKTELIKFLGIKL